MIDENKIVQNYIDYISCIITNETLIPHQQFSLTENIDKARLIKEQHKAIQYITSKLNAMFHIRSLTLALFIVRNECKKLIYNSSKPMDWSLMYTIINIFFVLSYFQSQKPNQITCNQSDFLSIKDVLSAILAIINNNQVFNASFYDPEAVEKFMNQTSSISSLKHDLHSYCITNLSVLHCLEFEKTDPTKIKDEAIQALPTVYIRNQELTKMNLWDEILRKYSLSEPHEVLRIPIIEFNLISSKIRGFLELFNANKCNNPLDPETELIFTYRHGEYYYIAISVMNITQELIEKFSMWGQYSKVIKYYFSQSIDQRITNKYNRLLTYKIADLLLNHNYVLPIEKKHNYSVPMIELKHYTSDRQRCASLGDIDISFYSPLTNTIYLLEFKNYQMLISTSNNFSYDLEKVERDNVDKKVLKRKEYISANIEDFSLTLYKKTYPDCTIHSIILSTKPCFYFYLNHSTEYDYYDWIQFKNRIENQEL